MAKVLLSILLISMGLRLDAQSFPTLRWSPLTEKEGLSCDKANTIAQDADGIIWIATSNGLNRWDGYGFAKYFSRLEDTASLPDNDIEKIYSDRNDHLWLETGSGICCFNTHTHKTIRFQTGTAAPVPFRTYDNSQVWFDEKEAPYVVSPMAGLFRFTDDRHYISQDEGVAPILFQENTFQHYEHLVRDSHGMLWAFQQNRLFRIDPVSKKVIRTFLCKTPASIYDVVFDSHNRAWVSTWLHGVYRFDPADETWARLPAALDGVLVKNGVEWSLEGRRYIVFSTNKADLLFFDEETDSAHSYLPVNGAEYGTPFVDRQNILWIPTTKGVYYVNSYGRLFDLRPVNPSGRLTDSINWATPYNMREEKSGYWISCRYRGGLYWYDRQWRLRHFWPDVVDSLNPAMNEEVATLQEAYDFKQLGGELFITTEWGMLILHLKNFHRTLVRYPATKPVMRLRTIVDGGDGKWWIRSFDQGVFLFDTATRRFTRHYLLAKCAGCELPQVNFLLRDRRGRIFATTTDGLFRYDVRTDSFLHLTPLGPPVGNTLIGMAEDRDGRVWIGNENGISAYDPDSNTIVHTVLEHNSIGAVFRISIDSQQNAWFRSAAGYWCWLRKQDKAIPFKFSLGLPDNDEGLFYTASDGTVFAGGTGTLIRWHPEWLMNYHVSCRTTLVDATVNNTLVAFGTGPSGEKMLHLRPDENSLRIGFDVTNYDIPENNLYFYQLKPGQGNWQQLENGRLSFNDLPAGEYQLLVRGANKLTGEYTPPDKLLFTIDPYWYQSSWFRVLVIVTVIVLIAAAVRKRIADIRRESAFREKIADTEMQALRAQMNPHFLFNSLNSIENFMMKNEKWLASDYLNKFARLIRMILSSSRNELVPFSKDMEALQLYVDLELLRYNRKFGYKTQIDPALAGGDYRVPSLLIQPYVENAIIHGVGLSDKPELYVRVTAFLRGEYIHYLIEDNGIGRAGARAHKERNRPHHKSIGLTITEDRIHIFSHQHGSEGRVTITDEVNADGQPAGTKVEVVIKAV
ncbi:MAG TPA: histidine kinase [Puia sp.]|uniref:ligand-binding sensor domain-containing protein n=1 Tax=Puia sp. TaxID=2045100 RepID=UPI002C8F455F|nr:histidine kinase [Puia sp.]HVU97646.1 histidine kinase [Puia sp.]